MPAPTLPAAPPAPFRSHRHVADPERNGGNPDRCYWFMLACELYFSEYPEMSSSQKVTSMIQCLSGQAYIWAEAIWRRRRALSMSYKEFLAQFQSLTTQTKDGRVVNGSSFSGRAHQQYAVEFQISSAIQTSLP